MHGASPFGVLTSHRILAPCIAPFPAPDWRGMESHDLDSLYAIAYRCIPLCGICTSQNMMKDSLMLNYFLFKAKQSRLRDSLILNNRAGKWFNVKQSGSLPNDRLARYPDTPCRWGIQAPHARQTPTSGNWWHPHQWKWRPPRE